MNHDTPQSEATASETPQKQRSVANILRQILKFCVFFTFGIFIIWLFQNNLSAEEKAEIGHSLRNARWIMVFWIAVFGLLSNVFRTLRWNLLIEPMGYRPRFLNTFCSVMVGYFANLAIPRLGEVLRCTFLYRYEKVPVQKSLGTVLSERVIDVITFLLIFAASFLIEYKALHNYVSGLFNRQAGNGHGGLWIMIAFGVLLVAGIWWLVVYCRKNISRFKPGSVMAKIANVLKGFGEGFTSLGHLRKPWLFVAYSIGLWLCYLLMMHYAFHSLQALSGSSLELALIALAMGTIGIMVTPGGIGVYPVIISETLSVFGVAKTIGYTAGWIAWGTQTALIILAGLASLCILPLYNKSRTKAKKEA
ncbi:MAG: flippase-like domain-containing protein [Bacteroides sp.]|nr:flippase-like domain-containing protein [Ruminococcus flavefaciens]MCM1555055.1 flippase-like domain-containing protein [Bacteroides sp.]MCM1555494.1 flippase-like domain-containing protein [Bacteroides sp.]